MRPPVPVILNRSSGSAEDRDTDDRIRKAFRSAGLEADVQLAATGEEVVALARRAAAGASEVVVAAGGDGTIGSVASVLLEGEKALGVIPLGTLNHFAKDLEIPTDAEAAARTVVEGRVVRVDVGEVNGRVFVNNSSLGLYPRIVKHRDEQRVRLKWGKWPAFVWATVHALHRHAALDVLLSIDGREIRRSTPFVFVGNNAYEIEGFDIGSRDRIDRGELSLYLAPGARPGGLVLLAIRAFLGQLRPARGFEALRTAALTIETRSGRARVATDGEISTLETPLRYRVRPKTLRVVVPREKRKGEAP
ncbi:MAG: sphingosine kinase [Acidobacteria bacterium]|nr:MAG: sphingosine kinase [Acidobacteriota bacterium]PYQ68024.1 MAG: sphingosine kinase [Acidobacteriota bacterium]